MLSVSLSSAPQNTKSFHSLFLSKSSHIPKSPVQDVSNDDVDFVLNCAKRVLSIFQNFKYHNDLCYKCIGLVEQAIKILEEIKHLSINRIARIIGSNEYSHFNNLIFDIEFYFRKYDQRTAILSEVRDSIHDFSSKLENCINTFQQVYEFEKSKKTSVISKVKTLITLTKDSEQIDQNVYDDNCDDDCDDCDDDDDDNPNKIIIQQELVTSTGIHRGTNNIRKGIFISEQVAEKYIGNISKKSDDFTKFQKEVFYLKKLSRDCNNILKVNGYLERNGCLWIVEEWAEYNLKDYLRDNLNLDWKIKLAIARGIANALNYIHNLNLLHYNIKINSVLLNHNLEPKLFKFGDYSDDCAFLKSFKPSSSSTSYTSATEVYNFGIILWEIATQDLNQSKSDFIERRNFSDAPTNYLTLVEKALSENPHDRPTMQEMFDSLYQLETSYNVRYKKNLSERNMINTNSIVSNSSEDSPTLINESSSREDSLTPTPSISDDDPLSPSSPSFTTNTSNAKNVKNVKHTKNTNIAKNVNNAKITNNTKNANTTTTTTTTKSTNTRNTIIISNDNVNIDKALRYHENRQYSKAFKLFNEYNKQYPSSGVVNYWLGLYYYKGYHKTSISSKQSIQLSLKYFGEAAKLNHPDAQYYYSRILLNNPSTDCEENRFQIALEFLKKASDQNHLASMRWLGKIVGKGEFGCKKDIETSKILTNRSRRLSGPKGKEGNVGNVAGNAKININFNVNADKRKTRTSSNTSTTPRPVSMYKSASSQSYQASSKRNSTVFENAKTAKAKNRHSTVF